MIYKITMKLNSDIADMKELEDILDEYGIEYEINEIYQEVK